MKQTVLVVASITLALVRPCVGHADDRSARDCIAAVVNELVITRDEVRERAYALALEQHKSPPSQRAVMEKLNEALSDLITGKLLVAEGERLVAKREPLARKIEENIQQRIQHERHVAGSEVAFQDGLRKKGLTLESYRKQVWNQIMQQLVVERFVLRDLTVSPKEVRDYYRKNLKSFKEPAKVRFRQIRINIGKGDKYASTDKARDTANYLMGLLKRGHDFEGLAKEYSQGPRAKEGGLYEDACKGSRPKPVDDLLFSLAVGDVGGPAKTDIGFFIVKVEARKRARTVPFEEAQAHIRKRLILRKREQRFKKLIARLVAENYVESRPWEPKLPALPGQNVR